MPEDLTSLPDPGALVRNPLSGAAQTDINRTRLRSTVEAAVVLGMVLCVVAAIIGLRMALHATVVTCADGQYFPQGTQDFRCYAHRHAGEGAAIVIFSVVFGVLLGIAGLLASLQLRDDRP